MATALDLLEAGSLPELSDVLMQRFKAFELSLQDVSWQVAGELEVVGDVRPSLTSLEEQEVARRAAMLRHRLDEVCGKGGGRGRGAAWPTRAPGARSGGLRAAPRRLGPRARAARRAAGGGSALAGRGARRPRPGGRAAPGAAPSGAEAAGPAAPEASAPRGDSPPPPAAGWAFSVVWYIASKNLKNN